MFKIRVELQNTSALKIVQDLGIRVHADEKLYQVQQRFIHVSLTWLHLLRIVLYETCVSVWISVAVVMFITSFSLMFAVENRCPLLVSCISYVSIIYFWYLLPVFSCHLLPSFLVLDRKWMIVDHFLIRCNVSRSRLNVFLQQMSSSVSSRR